ncbi:MAG: tRNA (N6-isopentenyl adenosine(37)-C2)-methylthiotransferase MiaB, partial [Clostridia bacterium]|nr:tRNA (N6-isopentenyl adenosine(37)-C2)-methylthiotransferase MiaB [Clostridia bacterium]
EGNELYICIVGCMTEQKSVLEKIKTSYPYVDVVLGTKSMQYFAEKVYLAIKENKKTKEEQLNEHEIVEDVPIVYDKGYKASVSIIYGCNNFCSYCIVPYIRGRERSRLPEDILKDIAELAKKGYKEITLLGQNVNSYGNDFKGELSGYSFVDLLKDVDKIEGIEIIKFASPHPKDFTDELIEYISENKKISRQIHLPLQSGSTYILNQMNRKYTKEQYLNLVEKIKEKVKDVSFSTDIIVGFPGESEENFLDTLDVVKKVKFDMIYMFCYSVRKGTRAEKMENQIEESIKVERLERLKALYEKMVDDNNNAKIGKVYKVLIEGKSKNNEDKYSGRTEDNKVVVLDANPEDVGKILNIKIIKNNKWYLTGEKEKI